MGFALMYPVFGLLAWLVVVEGEEVTIQMSGTPQFSITGHVEGGVKIFYGIPFSKPRTPPNRFQLPNEYEHVAGSTYMATEQHDQCVNFTGGGSEDCLYLDVYVPPTASVSSKTHVMVYIHGGAWMYGSKNDYSGRWWAAKTWNDDVDTCVLVTVNYRMNILGNLESDGYAKNLGMHDNVMALQWIKKHISDFGGDEYHVTIYGESAGGMEILQLWASPGARGLFHRAISVAPHVWNYDFGTSRPGESYHVSKVDEMHNCLQSAMSLACAGLPNGVNDSACTYQSPTLEQLISASCFGSWYGPMSDGGILISDTFYPDICAKKDLGNGVPLLIGHNSLSINFWFFVQDIPGKIAIMNDWIGDLASPLNSTCLFEELGDRFEASGMMQDPSYPPMFASMGFVDRDIYATTGIFFNMISEAASRLPNVYQFLFNESAKHFPYNLCNNPMGSQKCELPFIITDVNTYNASNPDQNIAGGDPMDRVVQGNLRRVWAKFAKDGHPGWEHGEVGTFMDKKIVIRTDGAPFAPPIANLLYQIMCNPNDIPPPCGYASTHTCGDVRRAFRQQQCCGNPSKPFEYPMRRLSADSSTPSILHSMELVLQDAMANGGIAEAEKLANKMDKLVAKYLVRQE